LDFKPLVKFMEGLLARYGLWRMSLAFFLCVVGWRLPELITAVR